MKKICFIFLLLIFVNIPAFAIIESSQMTEKVYIKNQGYSDEILRLADLQKFDPYTPREKAEDKYANKPVIKAIRAVFIYLDPGLDDGRFGENNNIRFTNNWLEP